VEAYPAGQEVTHEDESELNMVVPEQDWHY